MTLLRLHGEIDLAARDALRAAITGALGDDPAQGLAIDLAEVTFIDCSAIGTFVYGQSLADGRGLGYQIRNARGLPQKLLQITGVLTTQDHPA
jgi:anti-anti-sigma factor